MSLQSHIEADYKQAFKTSDRDVVSALRMLKSSIKNEEIDIGRELTDDETVQVVAREVKRRRDAAAQYQAGGRTDLANRESAEATYYARYLPPQLTEAEIETIVREVTTATNGGPNDFGKVMGAVMGKVRGRADGNAVQAVVRRVLSG